MVVLYNITNHPYKRWNEKEKEAAFEIADYVEDVRFPEADPSADDVEVRYIAAETLAKADIPYGALALVAGEVTMAHAIVTMLQEHGCTCIAAINKRGVVDGRMRYEFQQFRHYPEFGTTLQLGDMVGYSGEYIVAEHAEGGQFAKIAEGGDDLSGHLERELAGIGASQTDHGPVPVYVVR